jgi:hypothetical protein
MTDARLSAEDERWRRACQRALLETDKNLLSRRIAEARRVIAERASEGGILLVERRDMENALRALGKLEGSQLLTAADLDWGTHRAMTDPRFRIMQRQDQIPIMAGCSKCGEKFFTPSSLRGNGSMAEFYLMDKFKAHSCRTDASAVGQR